MTRQQNEKLAKVFLQLFSAASKQISSMCAHQLDNLKSGGYQRINQHEDVHEDILEKLANDAEDIGEEAEFLYKENNHYPDFPRSTHS